MLRTTTGKSLAILAVVFVLLATVRSCHGAEYPERRGYAMDLTGKLPPELVSNLEASLADYHKTYHAEIVFVFTEMTDAMQFCAVGTYNYGQELLRAWHVGESVEDRGGVVYVVFTTSDAPMIGRTDSFNATLKKPSNSKTLAGLAVLGFGGKNPREIIIGGLGALMTILSAPTNEPQTGKKAGSGIHGWLLHEASDDADDSTQAVPLPPGDGFFICQNIFFKA
jgi:hypothetical protein